MLSGILRGMGGMFSSRCPFCRSIDFRSVGALTAIESALFRLLQPCHCELCGRRFHLWRWQTPVTDPA